MQAALKIQEASSESMDWDKKRAEKYKGMLEGPVQKRLPFKGRRRRCGLGVWLTG